MNHADVIEMMKHVQLNWPKCEWPPHIAQRVSAELMKLNVHIGQAKAAIDRLYMRTKFAPKPFELLEAIKADAVYIASDSAVEYAAVKAVSAKWSGVLTAMLNLKGTDWMKSEWIDAAGKEIYPEYLAATGNDVAYAKRCTRSFIEWASQSLNSRPYRRPWSESPIAREGAAKPQTAEVGQ